MFFLGCKDPTKEILCHINGEVILPDEILDWYEVGDEIEIECGHLSKKLFPGEHKFYCNEEGKWIVRSYPV